MQLLGLCKKNLIEGAILVIVVLFLILGNFRVALFVALSIPLSMLLAATGMVHSRIDGNLLSLGAIDFGIIVDGSVVMAENIIRRFANEQHSLGRRLLKSERIALAYESASEVSTPVLSGVAIIMIVYFPILTLTGIEGKMFAPMSQVVLLALLGSLVISFTLIPALIALFLKGEVKETEGRFIQILKSAYESALDIALANGKKVVGSAVGFLIFVTSLSFFLGSEFVPALDERDIALQSLRIPATSVTQSVSMQKILEKAILKHPEIERVFSRVGTAEVATDPMPPGIADGYLIVKSRDYWPNPDKPKLQLITEIEETVNSFPGNQYEFSQPIELRFNELISGVRSDVAVKIFGDDLEVLRSSATKVEEILKSVDGASDVKVEQSSGLTTLQIDVNREKVARYGIDVADVQDVVSLAVGGKQAGLFFEGDKRFDIVVRLPEGLRENLEVIRNLPVPLPNTEDRTELSQNHNSTYEPNFIPLHLLAEIKLIAGLNQVSRENTKRRIVIQSNVRGRDLGSFVAEASQRIEEEAKIPSGYWYTWGGQFENLQKAKARLSIVVPVSLLLIFFILFSTFGSARDSLLIFSGVPFALTGGVIALLLRDIPFSISAGIGFIALSGVAVLDGVVMVSFIKQLLADGKPIQEAVKEGALVRFRPVVMTSLVAALGLLPMALATSTGAEVQRPLATVVIGGVTSGLLLTLLVLPVLYQMFYRAEELENAA
jgi:cobalt-zinc-cadmium resistance protein CzcA